MVGSYRKFAWVLVASDHGTMIVNRLDYRAIDSVHGYGVGFQILEQGAFDSNEVNIVLQLLQHRRRNFGDGVLAIDCGANIGVHTVEWAKTMTGWGNVLAIEAQERIFYALAGNIIINNCHNARAIHAAIGAKDGVIRVPTPDYLSSGSFGSLELRQSDRNEYIGQDIDYSNDKLTEIRTIALDSLRLARLDLIKIDVEGMELEALDGAKKSISQFSPIILVEHIKSDKDKLLNFLTGLGYKLFGLGINTLAIHSSDPISNRVRQSN